MSMQVGKRKKLINLFILLIFLFTTVFGATPSAYSNTPSSEFEEHWAQNTLEEMKSQGIISGYSDGTFRPDSNITRAEYVSLIVRSLKLIPANGKIFSDTVNHWARKDIATANFYGIVNGFGDDIFKPNELITREQMAVILINALRIDSSITPGDFKDSSQIAAWARESVIKAVAAGLLKGYPDGTFKPKRNASRAEAVVVLKRGTDYTITKTSSSGVSEYVPSYRIRAGANPVDGGTVTGAGTSGNVVTFTATENEGYEFVNWTINGNQVSTNHTFQYTMPEERTRIKLVANFIPAGSIPVATAADLNDVRENLGGNYVQVANIDLEFTPYNEGEGWEPIGQIIPFTGSYDGNGYQISNIMINRVDEEYSPVGLFGYCDNAQLNNITMENVNITGVYGVGGLVGENYGAITNCSVTGSVYGEYIVGGLVGDNSGAVTNSYATGLIVGIYEVGGLAGSNYGTITNSYATGSTAGDYYVGGLVGYNFGDILDSYATGSIAGDYHVGGLVGYNSGDILDSYATGTVAGQNLVGGLVGDNSESITDSYATGAVTGWEQVGGLVGYNSGDILDSYATGTVSGRGKVGGLVGESWRGSISNSYALNPWLERTDGSTEVTFGRIVGDYYSPVLTNNYAHNLAEPFTGSFTEKVHNGKDGANLHSWQIDEAGDVTVVLEKSTYAFTTILPDMIVEGQEVTIAVNLAKELPGYAGYENVGVKVSAVGATVQLPTDWETGFAIGPNHNTTADITALYNEGGDYTLSLTLVDLNNEEKIITSKDIPVHVLYMVASAEDLHNVRNDLSGDYLQVADLDLYGLSWVPIGTESSSGSFNGSFNGNGYKITNLTISKVGYHTGLFGYVNGGYIENVKLDSVSVTGQVGVGGLVGTLYSGSIKNSHVTGAVYGQIDTGGLVGANYGLIEECSTSGSIFGTNQGVTGVIGYTGGLVGYNLLNGEIISSFSSASVVTDEGGSGPGRTGGLVGYNNAKVFRSYATGAVTLKGLYKYYVGGLVGSNGIEGNIGESYAVGKVTGSAAGGLVGDNDGVIVKCYYDKETTNQDDTYGWGWGIPKGTAEMKQQATFVDWDFADTWLNIEGETYPFFK